MLGAEPHLGSKFLLIDPSARDIPSGVTDSLVCMTLLN